MVSVAIPEPTVKSPPLLTVRSTGNGCKEASSMVVTDERLEPRTGNSSLNLYQ